MDATGSCYSFLSTLPRKKLRKNLGNRSRFRNSKYEIKIPSCIYVWSLLVIRISCKILDNYDGENVVVGFVNCKTARTCGQISYLRFGGAYCLQVQP